MRIVFKGGRYVLWNEENTSEQKRTEPLLYLIDTTNGTSRVLAKKPDDVFTLSGVQFTLYRNTPIPNIPGVKEKIIHYIDRFADREHIFWDFYTETHEIHYGIFEGAADPILLDLKTGKFTIRGVDISGLDEFQIMLLSNYSVPCEFSSNDEFLLEPYNMPSVRITGVTKTTVSYSIDFHPTVSVPHVLEPPDYVVKGRSKSVPTREDIKKKLNSLATVKTPKRRKMLEFKPARFPFGEIYDLFSPGVTEAYRPIKGDVIVPWTISDIGCCKVYYENPTKWHMKKKGRNIVRYGQKLYYETRNPNTFESAEIAYRTMGELFAINVRTKTGQSALLARMLGDRTRLYGIVTPEGTFAIEVPTERLEDSTSISVFEKDVKVLATFFVFPVQVKFDTAVFAMKGALDPRQVTTSLPVFIIDDRIYEMGDGEKPTEIFNNTFSVTEDEYEVIMHYGLS